MHLLSCQLQPPCGLTVVFWIQRRVVALSVERTMEEKFQDGAHLGLRRRNTRVNWLQSSPPKISPQSINVID